MFNIKLQFSGFRNGDPNTLLVPKDSSGLRCGLDKEVKDYKYLFFFDLTECLAPSTPFTGCSTNQVKIIYTCIIYLGVLLNGQSRMFQIFFHSTALIFVQLLNKHLLKLHVSFTCKKSLTISKYLMLICVKPNL